MKHLPTLLFSASAAALLCGAPIAAADDTEIFFTRPAENGSRSANVMFMFDTSGSMNGFDGGDVKRINRVKQAMLQVLDNTEGVNIGLGAFNGSQIGGAILYPTVDPQSVACPGPNCDSVSLFTTIQDPDDDAEQRSDGTVALNETRLALGENVDTGSVNRSTFVAGDGDDDVMQRPDTPLEFDDPALPLFFYYDAGNPTATQENPAQIGLRFTDVSIPRGATILDARVHLTSTAYGSQGDVSAEIRLDGAPDSLPFAESAAQRVSDRLTLDTVVAWPSIPSRTSADKEFATPDLSALVGERTARTDWSSGEAITVLMSLSGTSDENNFRAFKAFEDDPDLAPRLEIAWTTDATASAMQTVGLRFAGLDVPRNATITSATLEFAAADDHSDGTQIEIRAEQSGTAAPFGATSYNLSSRTRTAAVVDWDVDEWNATEPRSSGVRYDEETRYRSPDLSSVVQEVVNRSDWCGGNALALILRGSGLRNAWSRDDSEWTAPKLRISYDPDTVLPSTTCVSRTLRVPISRTSDDAVQIGSTGIGAVRLDGPALATLTGGVQQTIGLRFSEVDVPRQAMISGARLSLSSTGSVAGVSNVRIVGQDKGYAPAFVTGTGASVGSLPDTTSGVDWNGVPALPAGERLASPDIGTVIQGIVDRADWAAGNALALKIKHAGGTGERLFASHDYDAGAAAVLEIKYQLEGSALDGGVPVLRTAGDEMRDLVRDLRADGGTPFVDSYYEAASYMLGNAVDFGQIRGHQGWSSRFHRTSTELSWSGGELFRPPGCDAVDPNAVACIDEEILNGATYNAPVAGACQVNQIVMLSDGDPTHNNVGSRVPSLTGDSGCASRDRSSENCGMELATWLNALDGDGSATDPGRVITHTVGFNFSTPFLRDLATSGGGRFEEAGSATELANVFNAIINEAADLNTTFVAPAASVSRFNRLTNSDDVYYAMFKPDTALQWDGNLKRYALNTEANSTETTIVDRTNVSIFDAVSGGIKSSAKSYWPELDGNGNAVNAADGSTVAAGGAANRMPATRDVRTFQYPGTEATPVLVQLHEATTALDHATLGITGQNDAYREKVLRWARGVDVRDVDEDGDITEVRQQMGDPMHTTPFILHYDNTDNDLSRVFVGTNQGYLHAIDATSGAESWAVVPPELLPNLARYLENENGAARPYGLDGGIMGWIDDTDGDLVIDTDENAYVVVGMRRGGRNYYAFDVSDPDSPTVAWTIRGGDTGFENLGQTWSTPVKTRMLVDGDLTDVLVFAGGYDPRHDTRALRQTVDDEQGGAIYIVKASDGSLVDSLDGTDFLDMDYSIPGDINVIDIDFDGLADQMYVGDMGGQLWRFDIDSTPADTTVTTDASITGSVIADVNGGGTSGNRRFYQRPDIALLEGPEGNTVLNIAIGSGWRAHPLDDVVQDRLYSIRQGTVYGPPLGTDGAIAYPTSLDESSLFDATSASGSSDTSGKNNKGWYIDLGATGEKVLANALTLDGTLLFTTYLPATSEIDECSVSVGGGRLYKVDALYGDAVENLNEDNDTDGEDGEVVIDRDDRWRKLNVPGIPTAPQIYVKDPDAPIVATGDGTEDSGLGGGTNRTFWVEN